MTVVELVAGLLLLLGGGEALVRGSVAVALRLGVSPLMIGLTLVGFGTSTPELVASLRAAQIGAPGIAIGNVVGSNIANILLILGVSSVILPMATTKEAFRRDGTVLVGAAVLLVLVVLLGTIERWAGAAFLVLLGAYTLFTYLTERTTHDAAARVREAETAEVAPKDMPIWLGAVLAAGGIAAVVFGADLLVGAAIELARAAGLSEAVIGLTLVAVGTSLPEMVTSVMAALRRHSDVAFGNILGSNVFNILGIAGVTAVVTPIPVPMEIVRFDVWAMLAASLLLVLFAATGWRINRWEGAAFLAAYGAYLFVQLSPGARASLGLA
ncbi:MAG TPA: calcium/sodium antiporter [Azospirillum sp.]